MTLDARTRSSIYEKLRPLLGDDDANALMSEFPTTDTDRPVTEQTLRAELAELRAELRAEMHDLGRTIVMWNTGSVLAGMGLAATIARLLG
ncbi:MAG: hypothetical protein WHS89_13850 [Acidimicrobiales bacterium]